MLVTSICPAPSFATASTISHFLLEMYILVVCVVVCWSASCLEKKRLSVGLWLLYVWIYHLIRSCRLWTANHDYLVFGKYNLYWLTSETVHLFKNWLLFSLHCIVIFRKILPANWRLTLLHVAYSPTPIFTRIWRLASVNFRPWENYLIIN